MPTERMEGDRELAKYEEVVGQFRGFKNQGESIVTVVGTTTAIRLPLSAKRALVSFILIRFPFLSFAPFGLFVWLEISPIPAGFRALWEGTAVYANVTNGRGALERSKPGFTPSPSYKEWK